MSLLSGPVVFIDDEIHATESEAYQLLEAINATGRPVLASSALPPRDVRSSWFEHWRSLSFVVLDWDLSPASLGGVGSSTLSAFNRRDLFDFLVELMNTVYCPVFIISREDADDIRRQVAENSLLLDQSGSVDDRIAVFPKHDLMDNIVGHLTGKVEGSAALSVLRTWEQEFEEARNRLFIDFHGIEPDWPVYVWRTAEADGVDPAFEVSSLISSNLLSRVNPVAFDGRVVSDPTATPSSAAARKVLHGRTFLAASRLSARMVFPGDVFKLPDDPVGQLWINISPICQTVSRPAKDGSSVKPIRLHLIRGSKQDVSSKNKFKDLEQKQKGPLGDVVHTFIGDDPYYFEFGHAVILEWEEIKQCRLGRLLNPYATRLQQKHAAYLQAEGLPRVTFDLYD